MKLKLRFSLHPVINRHPLRLTTHGTEENCLLSDVPIRDLRPGLDYTHDDDHVLYAWKDLDPNCVVTGYSIDDDRVFPGPGSSSRPVFPPVQPDFRPGVDIGQPDPEPKPFFVLPKPTGTRPIDPDKPDPVVHHPGGLGQYGGYEFEHGIRPGGLGQGFGSIYRERRFL